jgi:hypothetical protein
MSRIESVSTGSRFVALDSKATVEPSAEIEPDVPIDVALPRRDDDARCP